MTWQLLNMSSRPAPHSQDSAAAAAEASLDAVLRELYGFRRFGMRPGLDNIAALLEYCGSPQDELRFIHVAGTNGKGSVCSLIASVLHEAGLRVGLYTSPHILEFNERIRIDGRKISNADLARLAERMMPEARRIGGTFFETTTAMALRYFADNKVDVVVLETGLGGRLDSTNIVRSDMAIITSISLDHMHVLGDDPVGIAAEKAAIIKEHSVAVCGLREPALQDVVLRRCAEVGARFVQVDHDDPFERARIEPDFTMSVDMQIGEHRLENLRGMPAGMQYIDNLRTALTALSHLDFWTWNEDQLRRGILNLRRNAGFRGRLEVLRREPHMLILDVAHNAAAFERLAQTFSLAGRPERSFDLVMAVMADKEIDKMLTAARPFINSLFLLVLPENERAADPAEIARIARSLGYENISAPMSASEALKKACAGERDVLAAGSFYLAEEVMRWFNNQVRQS